MHEVSLVRTLIRQTEELCEQHNGAAIQGIEVEIGPLSGVEPLLIRDAFAMCSLGTPCEGTSLVIREVPLKARCRECGEESELPDFRFCCPQCGERSLSITQGEEFRLINVTIERDTPRSN